MDHKQRGNARTFRVGFGSRLRRTRTAVSLTQAQMAAELAVTETMYGRYERGRNLPTLIGLRDVCRVLNTSADPLLMLDDQPECTIATKRAAMLRRVDRATTNASDETLRVVLHVMAQCGTVVP